MARVKCEICGEYFEQNLFGILGNLFDTEHICPNCMSGNTESTKEEEPSPNELRNCPTCGSMMFWSVVKDRWVCPHCELGEEKWDLSYYPDLQQNNINYINEQYGETYQGEDFNTTW